MKNWKLIIGILLIFILGALAGLLGAGYYLKEYRFNIQKNPSFRAEFIVKRLGRRLGLNDEQRQKVRNIVENMQKKKNARLMEHLTAIREMRREGFNEIRNELTPAQKKKMDQLNKEFERRMRGEGRRFGKRFSE
jgi:gas vesicle protein